MPAIPDLADLAIMLDIIHYLKDDELRRTLNRLHARIRSDSTLIIRVAITPERKFRCAWWLENFKLRLSRTSSYYRSIEEIKTILIDTGFKIERTQLSGSKGELVWLIVKNRS